MSVVIEVFRVLFIMLSIICAIFALLIEVHGPMILVPAIYRLALMSIAFALISMTLKG